MDTILFSAIGTTDPIRDYHDGSWLHCLRQEHPDLTVIYLTQQMCEYEDEDQRYTRTVNMLNEEYAKKGLKPILLEIIRRPELTNPHLYGNLYADIRSLLMSIHNRFPEAEILLNCSSGTPVIKSCLADMRFLLPFGSTIRLLQVVDPNKGYRENDGRVRKKYDLEANWELNEDRQEGYIPRVQLLKPDQHDILIRAEYAKVLIRQHDYFAASQLLAEDLRNNERGELMQNALTGADHRKMLRFHTAGMSLASAGIPDDDLHKEDTKRARHCAEMLLTMQIDVDTHHYADMLRKSTPLLYNLCLELFKARMKWDLETYTIKTEPREGQINEAALEQAHPGFAAELGLRTYDRFFTSALLIPYMKNHTGDTELIDLLGKLRNVESDVRNIAAHQLTGIGDEWIKRKTRDHLSSQEIVNLYKKVLNAAAPKYKGAFWTSYQRMDQAICDLLDSITFPAGN